MLTNVKITGLDEWIKRIDEAPKKFDQAAVRALNTVGLEVEDEMVRQLVRNTDLPDEVVRRQFVTNPATLTKHSYNIAAPNPMKRRNDDEPSGRAIMQRSDRPFAVSDLMRVVPGFGDPHVCDKCQAVINGSPYTFAELRKRLPFWSGNRAMVHPHCKCRVTSFRLRRGTVFNVDMPGQGWEIDASTIARLVERLKGELDLLVFVE